MKHHIIKLNEKLIRFNHWAYVSFLVVALISLGIDGTAGRSDHSLKIIGTIFAVSVIFSIWSMIVRWYLNKVN